MANETDEEKVQKKIDAGIPAHALDESEKETWRKMTADAENARVQGLLDRDTFMASPDGKTLAKHHAEAKAVLGFIARRIAGHEETKAERAELQKALEGLGKL